MTITMTSNRERRQLAKWLTRSMLAAATIAVAACGTVTSEDASDAEEATQAPGPTSDVPAPPDTSQAPESTVETPALRVSNPDEIDAVGGPISIETTVDFESQPVKGTFEVTDGADLVGCRSGSVLEYEGPSGITNELTCVDGAGSGTLTVRWRIVDGADGPGDVNGPWQVADASGDFAGLTGEGLWSGVSDGITGHGSFPGVIEFGAIGETSADEVDKAWEQGRDGLVPAGTIRLPELGGIQFELDQERRVIQEGPAYTIMLIEDSQGTRPAEVDLIAPTATSDGEPLDTVEELEAALVDDVGADLRAIGEVTTSIGVAHGFEYVVENQQSLDPEVARLQVEPGGWNPFPHGQVWLLDTERGLFMVTAESVVRRGTLLADAIATAARVLETIELVELD